MAEDPNAAQQNNDDQKQEDANADAKPMTKLEEILATREDWESIKKSLDAIMPTIDTVIRVQAVGNKPNALKKAKQKKEKQIQAFVEKLSKLPKDDAHVIKGMEIAQKLNTDLTAEEMGNFNFDIRRYTQSIVKIRKELMDEYKKLKKQQEESS
eukprot:CAMPEP_0197040678 /NCGR_PEP_ID=MMETSP1384-20130603/17337_1 /TAXON_ID=29189 /ORGANISM="Ammonia sp." /LENGTH=153 /DNA_ID=CAMNT_0042471479 /DNA_START=98 /DNA_END=559 /DNA_ORIENTATION=+